MNYKELENILQTIKDFAEINPPINEIEDLKKYLPLLHNMQIICDAINNGKLKLIKPLPKSERKTAGSILICPKQWENVPMATFDGLQSLEKKEDPILKLLW